MILYKLKEVNLLPTSQFSYFC